MSEKVKPSYKLTEVGVIPEDWKIKPLFSLSTEIGDGIHSTPNYVKSSEFYFINGNNLVNDRISITDSTMCVSEAEYKTLQKNMTDRTLLLSINGTIGNLAFYNGEWVVLGKSAAYINIGKGVSRKFISYSLKSRFTSLFFDNELTGTTIRNLSLQSLRNTPVPIPPTIEEQRAIAGALSDVDALIGALDQLITKKRNLKQAGMQQLLTGQKRLSGFRGEWKTVRFCDIADKSIPWSIVGGPFGSNLKASEYTDEGVRIIQLQNIGDGHFNDDYAIYTSESKADELLCNNIYPGEIILSKMGDPVARACFVPTIDRRYLMASDGIRLAIDSHRFNKRFVHDYINSMYFRNKAIEASTGSTRQRIGLVQLKQLPFVAPSLPEQIAIAELLSDMDAELTVLTQRHSKTRALKQGMMQELLTGRTRLV